MESNEKTMISIQATINAPFHKVWGYWTQPEHISNWNHASDDWHTTFAENDLRVGGKFLSRMEAKDGSMGFDFSGYYTNIKENELIEFILDDERKVKVEFQKADDQTILKEHFEVELTNPLELQRQGWQAILNQFKQYVESDV
jgi:uncharacterized protein YndB with AHSA1/START domain